jgi:hypothetical protein
MVRELFKLKAEAERVFITSSYSLFIGDSLVTSQSLILELDLELQWDSR